MNWTADHTSYLKANHSHTGNQELAQQMGFPIKTIETQAYKLGLRKSKAIKAKLCGQKKWTPEKIAYLQDNYQTQTNQQLADAVGLKLTVTRNKLSELGLKRIEMEYWTGEQIDYLVSNFRKMGNVDIALTFQKLWPKNKPWTKNHIAKKLGYLKLQRTAEEVKALIDAHHGPGGKMNTINQNSCSVNLTDGYVANTIAWRNKDLKLEVLKHPELLELKRNQIRLNRAIKDTTKRAG